MNKKVAISIITIFVFTIMAFSIWNFNFRGNSTDENNDLNNIDNEITNTVNISAEYVTDDCINEWVGYSEIINEDIESASTDMVDGNTRYLIKDVDGYICIYYLDNLNDEILYKKTDISTEYLSYEDLDDLEIGIEVTGSQELNKLLEDFE